MTETVTGSEPTAQRCSSGLMHPATPASFVTLANSRAVADVLCEHRRQLEARAAALAPGNPQAHHELAHAAACYAYPELTALVGVKTWPWAPEQFKVQDHRSNYVRAAALLLAEIERLDREALSSKVTA